MNISEVYLDKTAWYRDIALCSTVSFFIPVYLIFHWDKVVPYRFSIILSICTLVCFGILRYRYRFIQDYERLKDYVLCEGLLLENHKELSRRTQYQAEVQVQYNGTYYRFLSKFKNGGYIKRARLVVLLDLKAPQNSILLSEHPYLRFKTK